MAACRRSNITNTQLGRRVKKGRNQMQLSNAQNMGVGGNESEVGANANGGHDLNCAAPVDARHSGDESDRVGVSRQTDELVV